MTQSLSNVAVQQFSDQFQLEYQGSGLLVAKDPTVMVVRGVTGDAYKWKVLGESLLLPRGAPSSLVPQQDVTHTAPTALLVPFISNTPTDVFQQAEVNANERIFLARDQALAVARREDQSIIDALNASTTTNTIADGGTNLTVAKLREASKFLNDADVPMQGRHILIGASQLDSLLGETEVTSSDFNTVKALVNGEVETFVGFKFHVIGDRAGKEGGLPKTGDIRTCFAWHMTSVGSAYSIDPTVTVDWDPTRQSWLTIAKVTLGSIELQAAGIVKIDCDETA